MTTTKSREFGILLRKRMNHGTRYVEATLVSRNPGIDMPDREAPLGVSDDFTSYERPAHLKDHALDGLGIYGFVSDRPDRDTGHHAFIGNNVEYRDVFSIDERRAKRMVKTLQRVNKHLDRMGAHEPGDKLMALATALKLDFVVEDRKPERSFDRDPERRWAYYTVPAGRDRYRAMIAEQQAAELQTRRPLEVVR